MRVFVFLLMIEFGHSKGYQFQDLCKDKKDGNYSIYDVFMYLRCTNHKPIILRCPPDQIFNSKYCEDFAFFELDRICNQNNKMKYVNPWSMNGYVQCAENKAQIYYCNPKSVSPYFYDCVSNFQHFDVNIGHQCISTGKYKNYSIPDVFAYLECLTQNVKISYCPTKQIFDPVKNSCIDVGYFNLSNFCIGRRDGQYRNPWNCHSFINCAGNLSNITLCSKSVLVFDPYENTCDYNSYHPCIVHKINTWNNCSNCSESSTNYNEYSTPQSTEWSQVCKNVYLASVDDNTNLVTCKSQDILNTIGEWIDCSIDCFSVILNRTDEYCNIWEDSDNMDSGNFLCGDSLFLFDKIQEQLTLAVLSVLYEDFVIEFDVNCTGTGTILSISSQDMEFISVFLLDGDLTIFSGINSTVISKSELKSNSWNSIIISQHFINMTYLNNVSVNGNIKYSYINTQPYAIFNASVDNYAVKDWAISSLFIYSKTKVFWSQWSEWSSCITTFTTRTRVCYDNKWLNCIGNDTEKKSCGSDSSQIFWSQWSEWSSCNTTFTTRTRVCFNNKWLNCIGNNTEKKSCESDSNNSSVANNCCLNETFKVSWTQWSDWSSCYVLHGNILMNRSRDCNSANTKDCCSGNRFDIQKCYDWSTWSECSTTCGEGYRTQTSLYVAINSETKTEVCNFMNCPVDGKWGSWSVSGCSTTCGNGNIYFNRSCDNPHPAYNGQICMGVNNYTEDCSNNIICPVNGFWDDWSSWSICNQPCEGGSISRFRSCITPKYGGQYCEGNSTHIVGCLLKPCKKVDLNMFVYFVDVLYQSDNFDPTTLASSKLKVIITNALANLYSSFDKNVTFNIELHSIRKVIP